MIAMCDRRGRRRRRRERVRRWLARSHRRPVATPLQPKPAPIALVRWNADARASWTMHETRAAAMADAPADEPYSIVDITAKPRVALPDIGELVHRARPLRSSKDKDDE
jgi:hypothetical protein